MHNLATLSGIAAAEIQLLESEGITPTAQDIVTINYLASLVENPESRQLLARGVPVFVGGRTLWPLTLFAADWYERVGCKLAVGILKEFALAYAMMHGRTEGTELDCGPMVAAVKVLAFGMSFRCTMAELRVAMARIISQDEEPERPPNPDGQTMTSGEFSVYLAATCGGDPDYWERRCTASYAGDVLAAIMAQDNADGKDPKKDERMKADQALGLALYKIRNRGKEDG